MKPRVALRAVVLLATVAACTTPGPQPSVPSSPPSTTASPVVTVGPDTTLSGGTLRLLMAVGASAHLDPQKAYQDAAFELFRCCLLRTLMTYGDQPVGPAGVTPRPDLAAEPPTVSKDGLIWTFRLKPGIRYAPPLDEVTVTAPDLIRALEREGCTECSAGGYRHLYSVIEGFDDFAEGLTDVITGMEAPNALTLRVRVVRPTGYLPHLFALAATAPIPPFDGQRLGIATGHDGHSLGWFLVGTGPYMFQGTRELDFSRPPEGQRRVAGLHRDSSFVLVRNPSWDPDTDDLRLAYPGRITAETMRSEKDVEVFAARVDLGLADLLFDFEPPTGQVHQYLADDSLRNRVHVNPRGIVRFIGLRVAQPPFDDVHVRRAVNFVLNRSKIVRLEGGAPFHSVAHHLFPGAVQRDGLRDYNPFASMGDRGSLARARGEMSRSRYDRNADGRCDSKVCRDVLASVPDQSHPTPDIVRTIANGLEQLGITLNAREPTGGFNSGCPYPANEYGMCLRQGFGLDFPEPSAFAVRLFSRRGIGDTNVSLLGAAPFQLKRWGYETKSVPSVNGTVARCAGLTREDAVECWAALDRRLTEEIVPWVPIAFDNNVDLVSDRVVAYSFSAATGMAALDRVAVRVGRPEK